MTDVSKVQGPSGPPEGSGKKEKSPADADKFKEQMHKRVTEVGKVDPDEQKKRKQREEADEEEAAAPQAGPTTPAGQVTPFSLEKEVKKASPLDMDKQGPRISLPRSAQPPPPSKVESSFYPAPLTQDASNASAESFKTPPTTPLPKTPQPQQTPWKPEGQRPLAAGPPESQQQYPKQGNAQREEQKKGGMGMPQKIAPPSEGHTADALRDAQGSKQQDAVFFEQMGKDKEHQKGKTEEKKSQEIEESNTASGSAPMPNSFSQIEDEKKEEKDKVASSDEAVLPGGTIDAQAVPTAAPGPETLPPYAHLSPQVQEMFDRMVGVMTVMSQSGMTETTITLNSPQFASSVFFGTQIIIQEFSTAPQAFNIQINGTPQAVGLIQGNANDLMAAFQAGNYGFRVNRLETGYLAARPLIKRKEKAEGDKQDQPGEGS